MHSNVLQLDPRDNVLIALTDLNAGEPVAFNGHQYQLPKSVPAKHKFATENFQVGDAAKARMPLAQELICPPLMGGLARWSRTKRWRGKRCTKSVATGRCFG